MNTEVSDGWRPGDLPLPLSPLSHSPSKTARPSAPSAPEGCWPGPQGSFWGQQSYITCVCLYGQMPLPRTCQDTGRQSGRGLPGEPGPQVGAFGVTSALQVLTE